MKLEDLSQKMNIESFSLNQTDKDRLELAKGVFVSCQFYSEKNCT